MRTKVILAVAAVLMLIVGIAAIGSNMGFKISIPLTNGTSSYVSIPFYNSYTDAAGLRNDINASISSTAQVFNYNGSVWQRWAGGGIGQVNFAIASGAGYGVLPAASGNWIVVGSHNPSLAVSFTNGTNAYVSVPYHTTCTDAALLRNEINGSIASTVQVFNYNGSVWQRWAGGGIGQVNFAITAGSAVGVLPAGTGTWTPSHY